MTTAESVGGMSLFDAARSAGVEFANEIRAEDRFVKVNGMAFHYLDWGNDHLPPMLLLHGGAQNAHMWDFFSLVMRDHFHIVAVDQRGHGDTDWSEAGDYDTPFHVADMAAFTDALELDPVVLIGMSMGGRNAYGFAAAHPAKVDRLIIIDVGPDVQAEGRKHIAEFMEGTDTFESFDWLVERVCAYNPRRPEKQIRGSLINNLKQLDDGSWTWKHDRRRGIRRDRGGEMNEQAWQDLSQLVTPTLLVRGGESNILSAVTAEKMQQTMNNCSFVEVAGAGHLVPSDKPVDFERVAREFLGV